jgi:hypothetical protein
MDQTPKLDLFAISVSHSLWLRALGRICLADSLLQDRENESGRPILGKIIFESRRDDPDILALLSLTR